MNMMKDVIVYVKAISMIAIENATVVVATRYFAESKKGIFPLKTSISSQVLNSDFYGLMLVR